MKSDVTRGALNELVKAGLLKKVDGNRLCICEPQYNSCLECPFVKIIGYDEVDESDVGMNVPEGELYIIPLDGVCDKSGDALPNFEILPDCSFLKDAIKRRNDYEMRKKRAKLERVRLLRESAENKIAMLANPLYFK